MGYLLWHYLRDSAARYPDRPAVQAGDAVLTYAELDEASARLGTALASRGVGPGTRIGLYMPRSERSVVVTHGASKAGAAYVPIDPNAPAPRAGFILANGGVTAVATTARKLAQLADQLAALPSLSVVLLVDAPAGPVAPPRPDVVVLTWAEAMGTASAPPAGASCIEHDPAYLLYTSGSTGSPKGVIISHRNARAFVDWVGETFAIGPDDRLSNHAPLHFDLSVLDIYGALSRGACVVMVPDGLASFPVELATWIAEQRISIWYSVPSALTRLLLHGELERFAFERLRAVLYAGEVFPVKYLREVMPRFPHGRFFNLYGPTETNVCTWYALPAVLPADVTDVPIGSACANTATMVLTIEGREAGVGEEGELYVRGPTVMLGYWGLPEKTAEMLVTNPLQSAYAERAYRTGDIVRVEADGALRFLGRRDHMVKSRGYRIELGEIEQTIYQDERVKEAVVVAIPDDEIGCRLKAVVVPHPGQTVSRSDLMAFCLKRLPRYMVPEEFRLDEEIPRTSTGKADRQAVLRSFSPASPE